MIFHAKAKNLEGVVWDGSNVEEVRKLVGKGVPLHLFEEDSLLVFSGNQFAFRLRIGDVLTIRTPGKVIQYIEKSVFEEEYQVLDSHLKARQDQQERIADKARRDAEKLLADEEAKKEAIRAEEARLEAERIPVLDPEIENAY